MVVDHIERHDVVNAMMLAVVLLLFGFGILTAVQSLGSTVDEGLIDAIKNDEPADSTIAGDGDDPANAAATDAVPTSGARSPAEVTVRVGNGAGESGVAGAGTDLLQAAGYHTLPPKNSANRLENSVVFFAEGYGLDAERVADILGVDHAYIEAMPAEPGVEVDGASVIAIIGSNNSL
jgi:hypothetical protein